MTKYIPFILFTVLTNAAAQVMLKQGMLTIGASLDATALIPRLFQIVFSPWVFRACDLRHLDGLAPVRPVKGRTVLRLSVPQPRLCRVVAVFAWFLFQEDLNRRRKIAGIAFICVGTVLIAQSGGHSADEKLSVSNSKIQTRSSVMRHIIFGGDGFVGRHLAPNFWPMATMCSSLTSSRADLPHYRQVKFVNVM
jgi:hypothetical protein